MPLHPQCVWSETNAHIHITLSHPGLELAVCTVEDQQNLHLRGTCNTTEYECTLPLYGKVEDHVQVTTAARDCPVITLNKFTEAPAALPEAQTEEEQAPACETDEQAPACETDDSDDVSDLSSWSETEDDEEEQELGGERWHQLLRDGELRKSHIKIDWTAWKDQEEVGGGPGLDMPPGQFSMEALQNMMQGMKA